MENKSDTSGRILLFDGVCNLCNGFVQFIIRRDQSGKIKFASLQSSAAKSLLQKFNLPAEKMTTLVFISNKKYYLRSSAALHILKELGGAWKLFYGLMIIPRPVRDFFYNLISRNRYRIFGRRDECMVPRDDIRQRFIED